MPTLKQTKHTHMKSIRKIIEIDDELCNGCGQCVPDCAEGSLKIINGKARLVADKLCDGLGACLGSCPTGALKIIERIADDFDEDAVHEFLAQEKTNTNTAQAAATLDCGCKSSHIQTFTPISPCQSANQPKLHSSSTGQTLLTHWPIQIRLIPPTAPFLQNAHLLIAADCSAVAAQNFQERYLQDKIVLMGCPKFDDAELYIERFAEILRKNSILSITVLIMEVPCCSSMLNILAKAIFQSKVSVDVEQITISCQGKELERKKWM